MVEQQLPPFKDLFSEVEGNSSSEKSLSKQKFDFLYQQFISKYHYSLNCDKAEHLIKFLEPPSHNKKRFTAYDLFLIVKECGGLQKV
jgi:hypothetical protein